jgi:hypothetical protein
MPKSGESLSYNRRILNGFFWPRHPYRDEAHREAVRAAIVKMIGLPVRGSPCATDCLSPLSLHSL